MALKAQTTQVSSDKKTGHFYEGKEIMLTRASGQPVKKARHKKNWWPEDKRIEAATLWAVVKDLNQVHKLTGIPVKIVEGWLAEPWWIHVVGMVKKEKNEVLDAKITKALDTAADIILDRFTLGETTWNNSKKEYVKIPIKARDVSHIVATIFDKRQLLRGEVTTRTESVTYDQKLNKLKERFEALANSKGINPKSEPIESTAMEVIDAV